MSERPKYGDNFEPMYRVVIAFTHDMGEFTSDRVYNDKQADELVLSLRKADVNCYRKFDHWLEPGFVPRKHFVPGA